MSSRESNAQKTENSRRQTLRRVPSWLPAAAYGLFCFVILFPWLSVPSGGAAEMVNDHGKGVDASLLETGSASKLKEAAHATSANTTAPAEIKIVSYNIRWRGGDDLRQLIKLLREDRDIGQASIIGLQEVDRNRERTKHTNTARLMAEELGMYYAWAAPPPPFVLDEKKKKKRKEPEEETGVAILSPYPLTDVERIVLPHEGPDGRRRAAVGATVLVGGRTVRVYSVHAETRIDSEKKLEQLRAVLDALARHTKIDGAVVLGDFNTWKGGEVDGTERMFKQAGFQTPFPKQRPTWKGYLIFELKLDWIWLRGLQATASGITHRIDLSDHWPLWLAAGFEKKAASATPPPPSQFVR